MIAALLALALAGAPMPFAEAPAVEVWLGEEYGAQELVRAAQLPHSAVGLWLGSNMPQPDSLAALRRCPKALVRLAPALGRAHLEALGKLPQATLVISLSGPLDAEQARGLEMLGPQALRLRVARLDRPMADSLATLKNAEVELDVSGRVPDQEELGLLLGLSRMRRVARLGAADPPALVAALKAVKPVRLVVESPDGKLPEVMAAALAEAGVATRVAIGLGAAPDDLKRLAALPQVSLELRLPAQTDQALARAKALLDALVVAR